MQLYKKQPYKIKKEWQYYFTMDEKYVENTNILTRKIDDDNIIKTFKTQAKEPATWLFV